MNKKEKNKIEDHGAFVTIGTGGVYGCVLFFFFFFCFFPCVIRLFLGKKSTLMQSKEAPPNILYYSFSSLFYLLWAWRVLIGKSANGFKIHLHPQIPLGLSHHPVQYPTPALAPEYDLMKSQQIRTHIRDLAQRTVP